MKNLVKLLGIIAFVAVIGFLTVSCKNGTTSNPLDTTPTTSVGTIRVWNSSTYSVDNSVTMYLYNGSTLIHTLTGVVKNQYAYWYNVPIGTYIVRVKDGNNNTYSSSSFYLSSGQDKVLYYNGTTISETNPSTTTPTTGMIRVNNNSASSYDANVTFYLCNSSGTVLNTVTGVGYNEYAYWTGVTSGYYIVRARDSLGNVYNSTSFYYTSGSTKTLNYSGTSIY